VRYPGLESHPQHELCKRIFKGPGTMMSFGLKGGIEAGVCMCLCIHNIYRCIYIYTYIHIHICINIYTYIHMHMYIYICIYV